MNITACQIGVRVNTVHFVCFSQDVNATFKSVLSNVSVCAMCTSYDLDSPFCQFPNNNDLTVSVHQEMCPLKLSVRIQTRGNVSLSLKDSGKIFCSVVDGSSFINYTTLHLDVVKGTNPTPDLLVAKVVVPTASGLLAMIIVLLVVVVVLARKYRKRVFKRSKRIREKREKELLLQSKYLTVYYQPYNCALLCVSSPFKLSYPIRMNH